MFWDFVLWIEFIYGLGISGSGRDRVGERMLDGNRPGSS